VAGFPPFVGFWGKLALFEAAVADGRWGVMLLALLGSAVVLAAVGQAWSLGLWKPAPHAFADPGIEWGRVVPLVALVGLVLALSVYPAPLFDVADKAARELMDLEGYRRVVFAP
jgi:formate hydrogenlyase subunit 3/multisubunit Na+/H+ antiporter MnhD subunit